MFNVIFLGNELAYLDVIDRYSKLKAVVSEEIRSKKARIYFGSAYAWAKQIGRKIITPVDFYKKPKKADLYIMSGFSRLVPAHIYGVPSIGTINIHQSFLPAYRGRHPLNWALLNGEKTTGITIHHVNKKFDDGKIIIQKKVKIAPDDTVIDVHRKTVHAGGKLLKKVFQFISTKNKKFEGFAQDSSLASYYKPRTPLDGMIDWNQPAETIRNLVRSLVDPYPGAYFYYQGKKIIVEDGVVSRESNKQPTRQGTPFTQNGKWYVQTGSGLFEIRNVRNKAGLEVFGIT